MSVFQFKHFSITQKESAMKVGTDAMLLGAFVNVENKQIALDIGTGTGVVALMVAQKNVALTIDAVEIDKQSADEAKLNFENSNWSNRLKVFNTDFLAFQTDKQYDLIVSNPPYFSTTNENQSERKSKARHVSSLAIKPLISKIATLLSSNGHFWLIIPYSDFDVWHAQISANKLNISKRINIIGKEGNEPIRSILNIDFSTTEIQNETFCVRNKDNSYSDYYVELTREFHGVML